MPVAEMLPGAHRPPLHALTSLRFITALHVFCFHIVASHLWARPAMGSMESMESMEMAEGFAFKLASIGYVGVNWFFVLSGFILAYSYAGRALDLKQFWRARVARVYPAYFVALCLAAPVFIYVLFYTTLPPEQAWIAAMREHAALYVLLALLLLQSWVPGAALSVNPVGWSLSVEMFFYFLFPLLLPGLVKQSSRVLLAILVCLLGIGSAFPWLYVMLSPDGTMPVTWDMNDLTWLNVLRFNPLLRLPEFMVGVCGALLFLRAPLPKRWATPLVAAGLLLFAVATYFSDKMPYVFLHNGLLTLPFIAIIYGVALRPAWVAMIEWRPLRMLGEVSYSFFLIHAMVIAIYFRPDGSGTPASAMNVLLCLAIAIAIAFVLYLGVEQPMRRRFAGALPTQGR